MLRCDLEKNPWGGWLSKSLKGGSTGPGRSLYVREKKMVDKIKQCHENGGLTNRWMYDTYGEREAADVILAARRDKIKLDSMTTKVDETVNKKRLELENEEAGIVLAEKNARDARNIIKKTTKKEVHVDCARVNRAKSKNYTNIGCDNDGNNPWSPILANKTTCGGRTGWDLKIRKSKISERSNKCEENGGISTFTTDDKKKEILDKRDIANQS
jgi:hypothetical protein